MYVPVACKFMKYSWLGWAVTSFRWMQVGVHIFGQPHHKQVPADAGLV